MNAEEGGRRLEKRLAQARARAALRAWDYRQRHHARGAWFRLCRVLALAESVWRISTQTALDLVREGLAPDPVGEALAPPRVVFLLSKERCEAIPGRRALAPRLDAELLGAEALVLVPFALDPPPVRRSRENGVPDGD
ncbi:MAG: hypothetical protein HYV63_23040 [Candidatus Schekmanbacteria bacterium]|nr:hypothetical protein [Candidatus Schekmanbacteria bacterium]